MSQSYVASISLNNQDTGEPFNLSSLQITGGDHEGRGIITVGTSEKTLAIPTDIVNVAAFVGVNLDSTNYVEWGRATTVYEGQILAGWPFWIPLTPADANVYLKANTADCRLRYLFLEKP